MKPTILVTGGNGFLGSSLVRELKSSSQFPEANLRVFDLHDHTDHTSVEYFQGDIRDSSRVDEAVKGCDIVIHSAAVVDWGTRSPEEVMAINYNGTKRVISACKKYGVKVMVFTSTPQLLFFNWVAAVLIAALASALRLPLLLIGRFIQSGGLGS